jgi:hypothetical protein
MNPGVEPLLCDLCSEGIDPSQAGAVRKAVFPKWA